MLDEFGLKEGVPHKRRIESAFFHPQTLWPRMLPARQVPLHAAVVTGRSYRPVICFSRPEPGWPVNVACINTL